MISFMLSIAAFCSALKLFNLSANKFLNSDKAETAFGLEGAILLAFKCLLYNRKHKKSSFSDYLTKFLIITLP